MKKTKLQSGVSSVAVGIIVAVLVVAGLAAYMMSSRDSDDSMESVTISDNRDDLMMQDDDSMMQDDSKKDDSMMDEGAEDDAMMGEVQVLDIEGGAFYFDPNEITVKKGDTVKIVLTSVDMMHDFVIDELDVQTPIIQSGDTGEVEFTATKAGTYEFYCSVGEHRANGMVGTLIIEE